MENIFILVVHMQGYLQPLEILAFHQNHLVACCQRSFRGPVHEQRSRVLMCASVWR